MKHANLILFPLLPALALTAMGCTSKSGRVQAGQPIAVRLQTSRSTSLLEANSTCSLRTSVIVATSAKFGTVTADLAATVDDSTVISAPDGSNVLTFAESTPITLSASDDWEFHYVGIFGVPCTSTASALISHGLTDKVSVMSENTEVPIAVQTFTGFDLAMNNGGSVPAGSNFADVYLKIPTESTIVTGCPTGTYTLKLADGTVLTPDPVNYAFFTDSSFLDPIPHLSPLPKNMSFVLTLTQSSPAGTWEIPFTTSSDDTQEIDVPALTGFCP